MAEPTKDELVQDAEEMGIDPAGMTKAELEEAISSRTPPELGPVVPPGKLAADPPTSEGAGTKMVAPQTADEIPEAGR